ncbi:unnamed protein product, partial [Musa banksii]
MPASVYAGFFRPPMLPSVSARRRCTAAYGSGTGGSGWWRSAFRRTVPASGSAPSTPRRTPPSRMTARHSSSGSRTRGSTSPTSSSAKAAAAVVAEVRLHVLPSRPLLLPLRKNPSNTNSWTSPGNQTLHLPLRTPHRYCTNPSEASPEQRNPRRSRRRWYGRTPMQHGSAPGVLGAPCGTTSTELTACCSNSPSSASPSPTWTAPVVHQHVRILPPPLLLLPILALPSCLCGR